MTRNEELVRDWLAWLSSGEVSPGTIKVRRSNLRVFCRTVGDLTAVTPADIQRFITTRPGGAWSKAGYLSALRSFYKWAYLSGQIDHDPTSLAHGIRPPWGIPRPVPEIVLQRALLLSRDPKVRLALLLGGYAGLRRSEIATFHSDCIEGDFLRITGKGGRTRRIPIHPLLRPYLDFTGWAFPRRNRPEQHVDPETIHRWVSKALGGPYTTHQLRHRFATATYAATHDIRAVQELLGHSSPTTTARYTQASDDTLRAAVLAVA